VERGSEFSLGFYAAYVNHAAQMQRARRHSPGGAIPGSKIIERSMVPIADGDNFPRFEWETTVIGLVYLSEADVIFRSV
jgi:hypothetical protein